MMRKLLILAFFVALVASVPLFGQATAGSVSGQVADDTGAMLPGVTVELNGPAMQGTRTAVTDGAGNYSFKNVPPGTGYRVGATLSGFATVTKTDLRVYLGQDAHVDLQLQAALTESITVSAEAPLVDVTRTTTGTNVTAAQFDSLPTTRSFQQLTTLAPGVTMEMGDSRGALANSPNVGASSAPENNYIIDGLSTTDARYGTSGTNLTMNFVEEVQVMTGGYSAEFGRSTGGVFNVITKSGGNEFHGDLFGYYRAADWSNSRTRQAFRGTEFEADLSDNADLGLSIGGPMMRDRLWFFAAYDPTRRSTFIGRTISGGEVNDVATDYDTVTDYYAAKLTVAATPNHNLVLSAFGDPTTREGWLGNAYSEPGVALRTEDVGSNNLALRYTGIITPSFLVEASVGRHEKDRTLAPASEVGANVPRQVNELTGFNHGGFQRIQTDQASRDSYALKLSNFLGAHELRYGIDIEQNVYEADLHEKWFRFFGDWEEDEQGNPINSYIQERDYFVQGKGDTENSAIFIQDQWKARPNLTFNLGLRYEEQVLSSANGVYVGDHLDADGAAAPVADKVGEIKLDGNWAPRLGIIWDPANNGRTKVYAFAGRFFEAIPLDLNIRAINGERYVVRYWKSDSLLDDSNWYNPNGSPIGAGFSQIRAARTLGLFTVLDRDLEAQYQDEFILGGDYQFGAAWSAGVRLVDRELKRVIEDFGVFGDPSDPALLTDYIIGNPGEGNFGEPYGTPKRYYRAAELTLQRARVNNWQLTASYVYAQAKGNYEGLFMSGYEQLDPNITALYDIPSFGQNAYGKMRSDKPYQFKVHSSYTFPFGLTIGEGLYYSAGIPISAQGPELTNGYGDGTIFLKPRGSDGRTPDYWNVDLHLDYSLPFFRNGSRRLSTIIDVFNLTDNDETLEVDQDYYYEGMGGNFDLDEFGNPRLTAGIPPSDFYKTPILLQAPRTIQVGVKFTY